MADEEIERAKRVLARYGVPLSVDASCPGGCDPEHIITWESFPELIAGDLWQVRACRRCLRATPIRYYGEDDQVITAELPATLDRPPGPLWLRGSGGATHMVHLRIEPGPAPGESAERLYSGCGWHQGWPQAPVCAIRFAHRVMHRCRLCERAVRRAARCEADAPRVWSELVRRAREAIAADGHRDPWV